MQESRVRRRENGVTLPFAVSGSGDPALILMAFLGGSHREWDQIAELLEDRFRSIGIDLPGFGDAAQASGYTVEEMAEAVAETLAGLRLREFVLVGHSMSAKVAAVLARWQADGDVRLTGLAGLILVAPSPPGPEPMTEKKRSSMLVSLGQITTRDRAHATEYIRDNAANDLPQAVLDLLVMDVVRMNRDAWRAWLEQGSREDWSARVGILGLPVLVVAGGKDEALGPDAQRTWSMPHWCNARLASLHSNHMIPAEKPAELARLIGEFAAHLGPDNPARIPRREIEVDAGYQRLIASDRVSALTREVLEGRARPDDPLREPTALTIEALATLRALVDRILPQRRPAIDLAARIDRELAEGIGDGWRYAELPEDAEAYRAGLATLDWHAQRRAGKSFLALDAEMKDELLREAAAGSLGKGLLVRLEAAVGLRSELPPFDASAMTRWFEDVRADATRHFVAHPATLAGMGYSGIADGAETTTMPGFVQLGIGEVEAWEPRVKAVR